MQVYNRCVPILPLVQYVEKHEVAWQKLDSLMEFASPRNRTVADNASMLDMLAHAKECRVINSTTDDIVGFDDLMRWSKESDLLILVDNELLLCIAPCDKKHLLEVA